MSTAAPSGRLGWRLFPAIAAAAAMVIAASVAIDTLKDNPVLVAAGQDPSSAVAIEAPRWDMKVFPIGTHGGLTKKQRARFSAQRPTVTGIVRKVFGVIAGESGLESVDNFFTKDAARALKRSKAALPTDATSVVIQRRTASIGIQGTPPRTAAARVVVKAKAEIGGRTIRWSDRATLWMERSERGWRVIAFELARNRS